MAEPFLSLALKFSPFLEWFPGWFVLCLSMVRASFSSVFAMAAPRAILIPASPLPAAGMFPGPALGSRSATGNTSFGVRSRLPSFVSGLWNQPKIDELFEGIYFRDLDRHLVSQADDLP